MPQQKTVKLCGRDVLLTLRNCHGCEEPTYFERDVFVCAECSEQYLPDNKPHHDPIIAAEKQYHGDKYAN